MSSKPILAEQLKAQFIKILLSLWIAVVPCTPVAGANWDFTVNKNSKLNNRINL
jgi:hypothetical protein